MKPKLETAYESLATMLDPKNLVLPSFLSCIAWLFECLSLWIILRGFGEHTDVKMCSFFYATSTLAGAIVLAHTVTLGLAQTQPKVFTACYVPNAGVVYLIKEASLPERCRAGRHVEFTWNQVGPAGPAGAAPVGAVVFFNLTACPTGWTEFANAAGRTLVGRPTGGSVGGMVGTALTNLENRTHTHGVTVDPLAFESDLNGAHRHLWSTFSTSRIWRTFNEDGSPRILVSWIDGMANAGAGQFPLEVDPQPSAESRHYTDGEVNHSHTVDVAATFAMTASTNHQMPYAQLLACERTN